MDSFKFYIYAWINQNGLPYYIGKGTGYRAWQKTKGHYPPKDKSRIIIMENNLSEIGAYALERRYIKWWGCRFNNTGILINVLPGGDGFFQGHNPMHVPELKQKAIKNMRRAWQDPALKAKQSIIKKKQSENPEWKWHRQDYKDKQAKLVSELWNNPNSGYQNLKGHYIITDPNGVVYKVHGLKSFCRQHNLESKYLARQANGRKSTPYKGWTCKTM